MFKYEADDGLSCRICSYVGFVWNPTIRQPFLYLTIGETQAAEVGSLHFEAYAESCKSFSTLTRAQSDFAWCRVVG